jgi:AsmA-like C-terminal region
MKRALLAAAILLVLVVLGVAAYGIHLAGRLNTPEFQKDLLEQAKATVGTEVRVKEMDISLLSGVTLKGIAVANPAPFSGDLLTADAFVLRYRLRPLLSGRLEVERVSLAKPALSLLMDARGVFNYERLGRGPRKPAPAGVAVPLHVVLKQLEVDDGSVTLTDNTSARLLTARDVGFRSSFDVEGGAARGSGRASVATMSLGDLLFLRSVRSPVSLSKDAVTLAPIRAEVAGGSARGDVTVHTKGGFRYVARLDVKDVKVETLLAEAKSAGGLAGSLAAKATFEGSGGLPTMRGHGEGTVSGCRVRDSRTLALLASVLQVPELANPDFDDCRAEFTQSGYRVSTPVVLLSGKAVQLRGAGAVDLRTYGLDYQMNLALAPHLFAKVTRRELRPAFKPRADGFSTIDFHLYGTTAAPQTDLLARVAKGAAEDAVKKQLERLFRK